MPDIFDCVIVHDRWTDAERCLEEGPFSHFAQTHLLLAEGCLNSFSLQSLLGFSDNDGSLPCPRGQNASFALALVPQLPSVPHVHRANIPFQNDPLHQIPGGQNIGYVTNTMNSVWLGMEGKRAVYKGVDPF